MVYVLNELRRLRRGITNRVEIILPLLRASVLTVKDYYWLCTHFWSDWRLGFWRCFALSLSLARKELRARQLVFMHAYRTYTKNMYTS